MKKGALNSKRILVTVFCLAISLFNCKPNQPKIDFKLTRSDIRAPEASIEKVIYFKVVYNPKALGSIVFKTGNSEYTAVDLNPDQISSMLDLLNSKGLKYSTGEKEFILEGGSNE